MANNKSQPHELIVASPLAYDYDLRRLKSSEYAAPLDILFDSEEWKAMYQRRNVLFRAARKGDQNALKQITQLDKKAAIMCLSALYAYESQISSKQNAKRVSLAEYIDDFCRTDAQRQAYIEFSHTINSAVFLTDLLESYIVSAESQLNHIDPTCISSDFEAVKQIIKSLRQFAPVHSRNADAKLNAMFADFSDEVEEWLTPKLRLFSKAYREAEEKLASEHPQYSSTSRSSDRDLIRERLEDYFFTLLPKETPHRGLRAVASARETVGKFTNDEIPTLLDFVTQFCIEHDRIRIANNRIDAIKRSMPEDEVSKKITSLIIAPSEK